MCIQTCIQRSPERLVNLGANYQVFYRKTMLNLIVK